MKNKAFYKLCVSLVSFLVFFSLLGLVPESQVLGKQGAHEKKEIGEEVYDPNPKTGTANANDEPVRIPKESKSSAAPAKPEKMQSKNDKKSSKTDEDSDKAERAADYPHNQIVNVKKQSAINSHQHGVYWFIGVFVALLVVIFAFT